MANAIAVLNSLDAGMMQEMTCICIAEWPVKATSPDCLVPTVLFCDESIQTTRLLLVDESLDPF